MLLLSENKNVHSYSNLNHPILLFDGECNYCNRIVNFIIRRDKKKKIRFATLQSEIAKQLLINYKVPDNLESAILIYNEKAYIKSSTIFHVFYHLGFPYSILFIFILLPAFIRDFYYDILARNRYKIWGKRKECISPAGNIKERFLWWSL